MIRRFFITIISIIFILTLALFGAEISDGVRVGLSVCGEVVIPSLFPFMVAAGFVAATGASDIISRPLSVITRPLFSLPKCTAAPIFLSFISGYPVGAALAAKMAENKQISRAEAEKMLTFTVNSSPAMAIFAVGIGMFGSKRYGIMLYFVHIAASIITGIVFSRLVLKNWSKKEKQTGKLSMNVAINSDSEPSRAATEFSRLRRKNIADAFVGATADASMSMLGICGCVILFAGIVTLLDRYSFFAPLLEVTVGCRYAAKYGLPLASATLGFGGLSVIMQVMTLSKGLIRPTVLIASRLTHAALSFLLCNAAMAILPQKSVQVLSNSSPILNSTMSVAAPASAALLLLSVVVMWSAKRVKN